MTGYWIVFGYERVIDGKPLISHHVLVDDDDKLEEVIRGLRSEYDLKGVYAVHSLVNELIQIRRLDFFEEIERVGAANNNLDGLHQWKMDIRRWARANDISTRTKNALLRLGDKPFNGRHVADWVGPGYPEMAESCTFSRILPAIADGTVDAWQIGKVAREEMMRTLEANGNA